MRRSDWGCKAPWKARWSVKLFFFSIPLTLLLLQTQHNLTNHPLHKYPLCALFHHLVKPQFPHLWRLLTISPWSEGINVECGAPFLSRTSAWLAWLCPAMEHWSEANTCMPATSGMQAHCIFELTLSHFRIETVLLSCFLHKISKDCCLPSLRRGWRAWGREGWLREHGWAWRSGGGRPWIPAISRVQLGSSDLQHPSAVPCWQPGPVVSPRDPSQGKAFSHSIFVEVSCIQAWRGGGFCPLFMLREHIYGCCQWSILHSIMLFGQQDAKMRTSEFIPLLKFMWFF